MPVKLCKGLSFPYEGGYVFRNFCEYTIEGDNCIIIPPELEKGKSSFPVHWRIIPSQGDAAFKSFERCVLSLEDTNASPFSKTVVTSSG